MERTYRVLSRRRHAVRAYSTTTSSTQQGTDSSTIPPPWRPATALDEWVEREARPISLRQLTVFGRTLSEGRLLSSANYVRLELPTRIAHRLRNMQTLPYSALTNQHISHVHELYYSAFEKLRKVPEVRTLADNDQLCAVIRECLHEHLSVIPALAMGVLEIQSAVPADVCDQLMRTMLRSRISRRVIAEQHLALTDTYHSPHSMRRSQSAGSAPDEDFIGEVFLKCKAREIIDTCSSTITRLARRAHGKDTPLPEVKLFGDVETTFPYIPSHIEYIIGELLRNSTQAILARARTNPESWTSTSSSPATPSGAVPPIEVLICESAQHIIIRVSDQGGGVARDVLPYLWSFTTGPRKEKRLKDLEQVPRLAGTLQEIAVPPSIPPEDSSISSITDAETLRSSKHTPESAQDSTEDSETSRKSQSRKDRYDNSLSTFTARPPGLRLGIGLPMSRIYAEYWAGSLELHSLEGYGVDAFLQISKLGNRNEVLSTRASMDAV
ncbi:branched-chain alpha-ketoacid dehydrogenase [Elsinoe ampelina]|uniref:Protein-serine/threonine kinase n=1 Tax=Elsinoe ampelina TaxID=302913 RepID=A0A6A6G490_9PEZI|nr:branched-chain alpha-ketoacid dehydrogenase [Elsinoe ampelina]